VVPLLLAAALAAGAPVHRTHHLGRSWDGRPIDAIEVGDPGGTRVLVVGCIHGNETAGIPVALALAKLRPVGVDLWIVPSLNPDGVARGTRQNAHGVDLNRNFPVRWKRFAGVYASGPHPLSEREARIAYKLILRLRPSVTIWFHQHLDLVWAGGGKRKVERAFARVAALPFRLIRSLDGTAVTWQNHVLKGTTAFAAELPAGSPSRAAVARYVRAVLAAARAAG